MSKAAFKILTTMKMVMLRLRERDFRTIGFATGSCLWHSSEATSFTSSFTSMALFQSYLWKIPGGNTIGTIMVLEPDSQLAVKEVYLTMT
jgi:hypothetical protein